jgi:hypothetical protein
MIADPVPKLGIGRAALHLVVTSALRHAMLSGAFLDAEVADHLTDVAEFNGGMLWKSWKYQAPKLDHPKVVR